MAPLNPMTAMLIMQGISALGSTAASALSDGQEMQPFEGNLSPESILGGGVAGLSGLFNQIAGEDYAFPDAYVQTPESYSGGGLPMTIGLSGRDPKAGVGRRLSDVVKRSTKPLSEVSLTPIASTGNGTRRRNPSNPVIGHAVPRPGGSATNSAGEALSALQILRGTRTRSGGTR